MPSVRRILGSGNIAGAGYDKHTRTLRVVFKSGVAFDYLGPDEDVLDGLLMAVSPGRYVRSIVQHYDARPVEGAVSWDETPWP